MADDINRFLSKNQRKPNQNPKFLDSSPTSSVFGRLGYNFTPSDPSILELSPGAKDHLARMPKLIRDWQAEDMRTGTVSRANYYQNPIANAARSLQNVLEAIKSSIPTSQIYDSEYNASPFTVIAIPELAPIYESATIASAELNKFIDHTDRLSNVVEIKPDTAELPHYEQAMAIGRQLLYIVYQTDNIQNNAPILGSFTSIFIGPELNEFISTLSPYPSLISESITVVINYEAGSTYTTNLSPTQIAQITSDIKEVKYVAETRRMHDEAFWKKAQVITDEYQQLKSMTGGETQKKLINDYIGTDELNAKLEIKDIPVPPRYNVSVSWDGTIRYNANNPEDDSFVIPSVVVRTQPITGTVTYYEELPMTGNVVGDTYYVTSTGETWRWNGSSWVLISKQDPVSPTLTLDEYIDYYSNNSLNVAFSGFQLRMTPAALKFETNNGVWSSNATIEITNTGTKDFIYSGVSVSNFLSSEVRYSFSPASTSNTIGVGNTVSFTVAARSLTEANTVDYGVITIVPGLRIRTKLTSTGASYGLLSPAEISYNVGSPTQRLPINVSSGPYPILSPNSQDPDLWTWRNLSGNSVTISSITNVTQPSDADDMFITFYQADTPNTLNTNDSVLWYANVIPLIEFPNVQSYIVSTTDGQQRLLKIGIDPGNVDDGSLYNEVVNTEPNIIVTNNVFDLRVFGGKPNTLVTISGPQNSSVRLIPANGNIVLANNIIQANGTYTWVFDFNGTNHRRTITKAIFTS